MYRRDGRNRNGGYSSGLIPPGYAGVAYRHADPSAARNGARADAEKKETEKEKGYGTGGRGGLYIAKRASPRREREEKNAPVRESADVETQNGAEERRAHGYPYADGAEDAPSGPAAGSPGAGDALLPVPPSGPPKPERIHLNRPNDPNRSALTERSDISERSALTDRGKTSPVSSPVSEWLSPPADDARGMLRPGPRRQTEATGEDALLCSVLAFLLCSGEGREDALLIASLAVLLGIR